MVRELAQYRVNEYDAVFRWPLRESLIAYVVKMRGAALHEYERELSVWAAIAPHSSKKSDPPKVPRILRARELN